MKAKGNFRMVMVINSVADNDSEESMTSTEIGDVVFLEMDVY